MTARAIVLGVRQPKLDDGLRALLRESRPFGLILFREACVAPDQVRALCADLRDAAGDDAIIAIDQEGGRVARMRPPAWPSWPAAKAYGDLFARNSALGLEAARLGHRLIAHELKAVGVNVDFAPVCDAPVEGADLIIGDRAFAPDPEAIAALARAALEGLHDGGVAGCVKHMPGHGRAEADSHLALPCVREGRNALAADFLPFRLLNGAEAAMTAHIVFAALDPDHPATHSKLVIESLIRKDIGFEGLLFSDDLDMKALSGPLRTRAEKAIAAGCDIVLQCSGVVSDMAQAVEGAPMLAGSALARAARFKSIAQQAPQAFDAAAAWWRLRALMGPSIRATA